MPKFREITGQFVGYVPDSIDTDFTPDREPMNGLVKFTPVYTGGVVAFPELSPPEFAKPQPIYARIIDGFVRVEVLTGGGEESTSTMQPLYLMVTVDDEATQVWSWRADFSNITFGVAGEDVEIPSWSFRIPDGVGPIDLTEMLPVKSSAGGALAKGPRGAGLQNITAVDGRLVFAYTDGEESIIDMPDAVQGPEGPEGPRGPRGEVGATGEKGDPGEIPDLLVSNITDATPTGKNLMLAATEGAARNALGLQAGATAGNGSLAELETGTSNTARVWTPRTLADYVGEHAGEPGPQGEKGDPGPAGDAGPKGDKGDAGDVRFEGVDPGITVGTNSVLIGDKSVPTVERLWVKQSLSSNSNADNLLTPGEYWVGYTPSLTLANDWSEGYASTGYLVVHAPTTGTPYPVQERTLGATLSGLPVRKASRALLANGYGWTEWRPETAVIEEAIADAIGPVSTFTDTHRIAAFGDSQTDGGDSGSLWPEEESWPSRLGAKLGTGYTVTNAGFSGATVDEMLMKVGAIPVRVTIPTAVANNGNVIVTPAGTDYGLATTLRSFDLRLNGKNVRINVENNVWKFYNWTGATIQAGTVTLEPKVPGLSGDTAVVWIGGNDRTFGITGPDKTVADHIIGGTQTLIEWMSARVKNVMILGMQPRASEPAGTPNNDLVLEVNERLRYLYPGKFRSVFEYLRTDAIADMGMTPTADDAADIASGLMPRTVLSGDLTHINKDAARAVGEHFVHDYLKAKGWIG